MKNYSFLLLSIILTCLLSVRAHCQDFAPITVDLIYDKYQFYPFAVNGFNSMADGEHYTLLEGGSRIVSYDYQTGRERSVILDVLQATNGTIESIDGYELSCDEKKLLLATDQSMIYRYSFTAKYYVFDIRSQKMIPLSGHAHEQLATFSPDGNKVAYVYQNNLFIYDLVQERTQQVTFDGEKNYIINGAPDWVYEEEFGFTQAYCWSPDSKKLGFMRFDETLVKQFSIQLYNGLYPENYQYKYPKAGEKNAVVAVLVYDIESGVTISINTGSETDQYIPRIKWTESPENLSIVRLNRLQNNVDVLLANSNTGGTRILYHEMNPCFISEIDDDYLYFTGDNNFFIIRSERTGYFHYYLYGMDGHLVNPVTQGDWEVDQLAGIDEKNRLMYFTSTEASPLQRQLYCIGLDGSGKKKLSERAGTVEAEFSETFGYYISTWSDANSPPETSIKRNDGNLVRTLVNNDELAADMKRYGFSEKEFIRIPLSDDLYLNAYMIKPPDFDPAKKYPLFISVYGGPESQEVLDAWDNDMPWQQMLAQHGLIIACIDNRGTDGRGEVFRKSTYMQLGRLECEDQINATRYLNEMDYIDNSRVGIWGWSYGGYISLLCLSKGNGLFRTGIAVAPVTNWRFYDTIYTERFMRKPQENPSGYDNNAPLTIAAGIQGKLLLVHGTADDNVHLQNSLEMVDRLVSENKQFEMFFYPDRNHSIYGGNTRYHLFTKLTGFILENL